MSTNWSNLNDSTENVPGGFFNDSRNSVGGSKGTVQRVQNNVPVMIKHLNNSYSDLKIWGSSVNIITFIGILRHIEEGTTKETYEIEDETSSITAFRWLESEKTTVAPTLKVNTYVRVYGHLREQNNKKHVLILKMWPLADLNELTNHLLEVTYAMLKSEKLSNTNHDTSNAMQTDDVMTTDNLISGLTKEQTLVFKIIQAENGSENGIERHILKSRVSKNMLSTIDDIIDFLTSEGHIYTTLTDDHFKTT
ncbi:replication protein A 32 kDa subunit-like isoform X2 [Halictus rubicundus]|uniref:replication protein A 32 kDa subunit-like isoform X2 n=1 Tax=Halictus rubicundus TaxID=77578 RepID=UPI004035E41F